MLGHNVKPIDQHAALDAGPAKRGDDDVVPGAGDLGGANVAALNSVRGTKVHGLESE